MERRDFMKAVRGDEDLWYANLVVPLGTPLMDYRIVWHVPGREVSATYFEVREPIKSPYIPDYTVT